MTFEADEGPKALQMSGCGPRWTDSQYKGPGVELCFARCDVVTCSKEREDKGEEVTGKILLGQSRGCPMPGTAVVPRRRGCCFPILGLRPWLPGGGDTSPLPGSCNLTGITDVSLDYELHEDRTEALSYGIPDMAPDREGTRQ